MSTPVRCACALLAGVALSAAFEPLALRWLLIPALTAFFLLLRGLLLRGLGPKAAVWPGLAFGAGFMFTHQVWMRAIGTDAWIAISLLETSFFAVLAVALALTGRLRAWPLWWAVWWIAIESWRTQWPFGGMPWGRLAFAVMDTPSSHWLPWFGVTGVSLLQALAATSLAWGLQRGWRAITRGSVLLALVPLALLLLPLPWQPPTELGDPVEIAAVQGQVPGDGTDVLLGHRQITRTLGLETIGLAHISPHPDLVVWPENSTAVDPFLNPDVLASITTAVDAVDAPVLVGAMVDGPTPDSVLNQGIVWAPGGGAGDRYTKRHPVPYGEFIPYRKQLPFTATFGQLRLIQRDMMSGTRTTPLVVGTASGPLRISDALCFDVAYDEGGYKQLRAGVQLLVVQTSNAMFVHTAQIRQQFEISRVRAAESGKYLVVASMNGVSGIIAPDGSVVQEAPTLKASVLQARLPRIGGTPPAVWIGPTVGWISLALAALSLVLGVRTYRRKQTSITPVPARVSPGKVAAR